MALKFKRAYLENDLFFFVSKKCKSNCKLLMASVNCKQNSIYFNRQCVIIHLIFFQVKLKKHSRELLPSHCCYFPVGE